MQRSLRSRAYRWLASIFSDELSVATWRRYQDEAVHRRLYSEFRELDFGEAGQRVLAYVEGARKRDEQAVVNELAVDYSALFYGPGGGEAPLYESFYSEHESGYFADSHRQILDLMDTLGLELPAAWRKPADHVSIELDIAASCLERLRPADSAHQPLATSNPTAASGLAACRHHLQRWVPQWSRDVSRSAETEFYAACATLLHTFVLQY